MNRMKEIKFKKIFSIPGRIRLKAEELKANPEYALTIDKALLQYTFIISAAANSKTGNVLIEYDTSLINEYELLSLIQSMGISRQMMHIAGRNKQNDQKLRKPFTETYQEESSLTNRLSFLSVTAACVLIFASPPVSIIGALILGFPGMIYLTSYLSMRYARSEAYRHQIRIISHKTIRKLQKLRRIFMDSNIIYKDHSLDDYSYMELETGIATGELSDPIHPEVRNMVKELRKNGMNDISILDDNVNTGLLLYGNKSLGLSDAGNPARSGLPGYPFEMYIMAEDFFHRDNSLPGKAPEEKIYVCIIENRTDWNSKKAGPVSIYCNEAGKIPWLLGFCRNSHEYLTRSQLIAVSINILGIMLAVTGHLHFTAALLLYIINMLSNALYLRHNILICSKESTHGEQQQYIIA